jgi:hypothetical protein
VQYADFKRSVLDVAQGAGLIDAEARKVWDHADYIPFYRQIDERAAFSPTGKKGLAGQSSGIRTLKGGTSALNDPMENLLMNFSRLIDASLKNNALLKTVDALGGAGSAAIEKIGYDMKPALVPRSQIEKALEQSGVPDQIMAIMPPELFDGMAKMWAIQAPADKDVIRVMRGGKPEFYRVHDPVLLRACTSFVPFDFKGLGVARWFKNTLTRTVTLEPAFIISNFLRDSLEAQITSRDSIKMKDVLKGFAESYKESGDTAALLFSGASFQTGHVNAHDPKATAKVMRKALRREGFAAHGQGGMAKAMDWTARGLDAYESVREGSEMANRIARYKAAIAAGKSATEAAFEAKDALDFSLRGSSPLYQVAADILPFLNARMQGMYRMGRSDPRLLTRQAYKTRLVRYGTAMAMFSVLLAAANSGDDWYEELPDWDKDNNWHIMIHGFHMALPKPFELGAAFASLPERLMRNMMGHDTGKKLQSRILAMIKDNLAMDMVPQITRPMNDVRNNKQSFFDSPIESPQDEKLAPHLRYDSKTSRTMTALANAMPGTADALGASPKRLEYLMKGYFGTVGAYALSAADAVARMVANDPVRPSIRADELPVLKRFYRMDPARATVFESDLYEIRKELEQVHDNIKALRAKERDDEADASEADNIDKLAAREVVNHATKRLTELNKRRKAIYDDRGMTPQEKRQALDEIQVERNQVAKEAMTDDAVRAANK